MKLSKGWKIFTGLLTAWVIIYPFILVALWFGFMGKIFLTGDPTLLSDDEVLIFLKPFFFIIPIIMLSSFIQMGVSIFYLVHIIVNKEGLDTLRILSGVGAFLLPYIAMPFYYFVYIWPETPPKWALQESKES